MNGPMGLVRVSRDNTTTGRETGRARHGLGQTGVEIDPFHFRVLRKLVLGRAGYGFHNLPLLGPKCYLPLWSEGIDEHHASYLAGVLASKESRDQATVGVANQDIGAMRRRRPGGGRAGP